MGARTCSTCGELKSLLPSAESLIRTEKLVAIRDLHATSTTCWVCNTLVEGIKYCLPAKKTFEQLLGAEAALSQDIPVDENGSKCNLAKPIQLWVRANQLGDEDSDLIIEFSCVGDIPSTYNVCCARLSVYSNFERKPRWPLRATDISRVGTYRHIPSDFHPADFRQTLWHVHGQFSIDGSWSHRTLSNLQGPRTISWTRARLGRYHTGSTNVCKAMRHASLMRACQIQPGFWICANSLLRARYVSGYLRRATNK
jgi:hypothetical protein